MIRNTFWRTWPRGRTATSISSSSRTRIFPAIVGPRYPASAAVQVGPLINAKQRDRVAALVAAAADLGVEVRSGGRGPTALPHGYFFEPTVLSGVTPEMPVFSEEIFGPVMPIVSFDKVDEAIALGIKRRTAWRPTSGPTTSARR